MTNHAVILNVVGPRCRSSVDSRELETASRSMCAELNRPQYIKLTAVELPGANFSHLMRWP